jgi:transposase
MAMLTTLSPETLIPRDHPIRRIRKVVDDVLADLDAEFGAMYARTGRPSVPPEQLLKATVLMAMYSMRSERAFCERLNYDLLFKWFLDLPIDAAAFDSSTFSKNRQRLLDHDIADRFFAAVVRQAKLRRYLSSEHFSVDGTLLEAWASHKSFKPNGQDGPGSPRGGRNAEVDFHGQRRSNQTHRSTTDPEALLAKKSHGSAAKLCYAGHLLMEHRSALIVDMELTQADGRAERRTAAELLGRLPRSKRRRTVAADKAYDTREFVADCRELGFTAHVAQHITNHRTSAIDGRTTRHDGHAVSQRIRKRIEEPFGWIKTIAGGRKLRYIGRQRNRAWFLMAGAVYNVLRITTLEAHA